MQGLRGPQLLNKSCGSRPQSRSSSVAPARIRQQQTRAPRLQTRALEVDLSDPDTQLAVAGVALGLVFGIGAPIWYTKTTERDEERLEELRAMNRANFKATGEYLSEDEIAAIRKPKWTDGREFVDDD